MIKAFVTSSVIFSVISIGNLAHANELIEYGKKIVEVNCSGCHAIGTDDKSTHKDAPPFRTLSKRYPIDALAEAFAEGIYAGHPDMPEFEASPEQIDAILAYMSSIQEK
ncbi:c-type cytochrome [Paenochrobactrum pullorum]|uniref:c-type cytochrome n=1 Tax=Paenochrobactrum pullorum TaxID=1324351 RepID=UPI0035BBFC74